MVDVVLQPPPRAVPWSVRLVVMLGGVLTQIGFGIAAFGLVFVFVFGSIAEPLFDDPFAGPLQHLTGKVVEVETTNSRCRRRESTSSAQARPICVQRRNRNDSTKTAATTTAAGWSCPWRRSAASAGTRSGHRSGW